ncbi:MAG: glutamate 5-kinase [Phycisphaerales bacterium]
MKLGSAVVAPGGELDLAGVAALAADLAAVRAAGREVVVVTSGAVASGFRALGLEKMPRAIVLKQAAAAIGQQRLMRAWGDAFATHGVVVAQVLLTADDLDSRERQLNARRTLNELLGAGVVPIINENDSVSYAEIKVGDNDRLSALVAGLLDAEALVILSSVRGVYAGASGEQVVASFANAAAAREHVRRETSGVGTGGMATKIDAAEIAADSGAHVVIAPGREPGVVGRVLAGEAMGTYIPPMGRVRGGRRRWIGHASRVRGRLVVDAGAAAAIASRGASLLPGGVVEVEGHFPANAVVEIFGPFGPIARGVCGYDADEVRAIKGKRSDQIEPTLGYCLRDEVVHRNDMVVKG